MGTATYRVLQQTVSIANVGKRTFVLESLIWKVTPTDAPKVYGSVL
jgi:hypothetical protein